MLALPSVRKHVICWICSLLPGHLAASWLIFSCVCCSEADELTCGVRTTFVGIAQSDEHLKLP